MSRHPLLAGILLAVGLYFAFAFTIGAVYLPAVARILNIGAAPDRSWTPPPIITPTFTPVPAETPIPSATSVQLPPDLPTPAPGSWTFQPGDTAVVVNNGPVNIRRTPGYKNKSPNDRITMTPAGAQVIILSGPAKVDGLIWWYVDWNDTQGWMAERSSSGKILLAKPE